MTTEPSTRSIDTIARRVIISCAPEEEPHYPNVRDDFFARGGKAARASDDPLGFGVITVGVVTGIVLSVLYELVVGSLTDAARPWWNRGWAWLLSWLGFRSRTRVAATTIPPAIAEDQAPCVVDAIMAHAARADIPETKARQIAEAVVCELQENRGGTSGPEA